MANTMLHHRSPRRLGDGALRALFAATVFLFSAGATAQTYPVRPIRLIVPFAPGGGNDIVGRILAEALTQPLGQTVVVENRPGAGSVVGTEIAAKATPDGYTLFLGNIGLAFTVALYRKLPYDPQRDLAPVSLLVDQPNIMVASPALPAQNFKDFIALARATPGKLTYGSAGTGSGTHLAMELICLTNKVQLIHVPYKGTGPALTALLGNEISVFLSTFASALPHVKSGKLRSFGVTTAKRAETLPDVPTIAEAGMPGFEYSTWYGLLVPAGTPRTIIEKLHATTLELLKSAEVKQRYRAQGMDVTPSTAAEFAAKIKSETDKWVRVVRAANIPQQ
jgi:tripartite-type tricarboxylate transporter receptor subunit TctC